MTSNQSPKAEETILGILGKWFSGVIEHPLAHKSVVSELKAYTDQQNAELVVENERLKTSVQLLDEQGNRLLKALEKEEKISATLRAENERLKIAEQSYCRRISMLEKDIKSLQRSAAVKDTKLAKAKAHAALMQTDKEELVKDNNTLSSLLRKRTQQFMAMSNLYQQHRAANEQLTQTLAGQPIETAPMDGTLIFYSEQEQPESQQRPYCGVCWFDKPAGKWFIGWSAEVCSPVRWWPVKGVG